MEHTQDETPMKELQPLELSVTPQNLTSCIEQMYNELSDCDQSQKLSHNLNFPKPSISQQGSTATTTTIKIKSLLPTPEEWTAAQDDFENSRTMTVDDFAVPQEPETPYLPG